MKGSIIIDWRDKWESVKNRTLFTEGIDNIICPYENMMIVKRDLFIITREYYTKLEFRSYQYL